MTDWQKIWRTPPWRWPGRLAGCITRPIPPGLWLANVVAQRVLRINGDVPWMVHFTSCVVGDVKVGKNVWISFATSGGCYIQGTNGVYIGDETIFAPGVKIVSANHDVCDLQRSVKNRSIIIGRNCWIGANAVILPGVELGDRVVVGAGAVVTKSFGERTIVAGVPAREIGRVPEEGCEPARAERG